MGYFSFDGNIHFEEPDMEILSINWHDIQAENCTIAVDKVIQESPTCLQIIEDDEDYDDTLELYNDEDANLAEECDNDI